MTRQDHLEKLSSISLMIDACISSRRVLSDSLKREDARLARLLREQAEAYRDAMPYLEDEGP